MNTTIENAAFAQFESRSDVEGAIGRLHDAGYNIRQLLVVAHGLYNYEKVLGYDSFSDRIGRRSFKWAAKGALVGGMLAVLYFMFGNYDDAKDFQDDPIAMLGWLILYMAVWLALVSGTAGALWTGLSSMGLLSKSRIRYRSHHQAAYYLLIGRGNDSELTTFREVLNVHLPKNVIEHSAKEMAEL